MRLLPQCRRCIWLFLSEFPYKIISMTIASFEWTIFSLYLLLYLSNQDKCPHKICNCNATQCCIVTQFCLVIIFFFQFFCWEFRLKNPSASKFLKILWSLPTDNFFKNFIWFIQWNHIKIEWKIWHRGYSSSVFLSMISFQKICFPSKILRIGDHFMDFDKWEHNSFEIVREHSCKIISCFC